MKIQIGILIVCVVASFALPQLNSDNNNERVHRNENRTFVTADDKSINNSISSNETTSEKHGCHFVRGEQNGPRKLLFQLRKELRHRNSSDGNSLPHLFSRTHNWQGKQATRVPHNNSEIERNNHRYYPSHIFLRTRSNSQAEWQHRRYYPNQHRTTTAITTSTTPSTPLSDERGSDWNEGLPQHIQQEIRVPDNNLDIEGKHNRYYIHRTTTTTTIPTTSSTPLSDERVSWIQRKQEIGVPQNNPDIGGKSHRYYHNHHRIRTTNTTTTPITPLLEMEEAAIKGRLMSPP